MTHAAPGVERVLDRRQRLADARVVADDAALERDVEVDADEHASALQRRGRGSFVWPSVGSRFLDPALRVLTQSPRADDLAQQIDAAARVAPLVVVPGQRP